MYANILSDKDSLKRDLERHARRIRWQLMRIYRNEGYTRAPTARMNKEEIEQLDASAESYARLKNEVIYLREEVKLLKKLSQQVILGKRGES